MLLPARLPERGQAGGTGLGSGETPKDHERAHLKYISRSDGSDAERHRGDDDTGNEYVGKESTTTLFIRLDGVRARLQPDHRNKDYKAKVPEQPLRRLRYRPEHWVTATRPSG